ncbi:insulin-degrading enzyme isoform X1 [Microplitis demolitor]|uniref:insulin-degrading enzyme isoform X1 n=1 Tax=Microplitis demolitor TaxID=69319 RepID=UPI00235B64D5|nr:insulin-degrading enzyme isoform X1 [Microplitis demolitor]
MFIVRNINNKCRFIFVYKKLSSIMTRNLSGSECGTANTPAINDDNIKKRFENIKKSPNDSQFYRGLILNNDMKVLLISDPTTDKSAVSLDVNVGYLSDPAELPGLAHFCEHMLFLGTEKYPDKNSYNSYLSQHGGCSNAMTLPDYTQYHFDVSPEYLEGAVDRFAQFFIAPLFTESATELEVQAVHSEHEKNIANDTWRQDQLEKSSANPDHPYSKFGTGNRETLDLGPKQKGVNVRKALLDFHNNWYSANIMALSILGKESLDELEKMVIEKFAQVKNKQVEVPEWPDHPFNEDHFGKKWLIVPIKDVRGLKMTFPLPDLSQHFRSCPAHYVSHLLGHEADGSLLSALKKAGWCNALVAGEKKAARGGCNFFSIYVDLTEEGMNHVDDIVTLTFQYINMLRVNGPLEWIFDECKQIAIVDFNFKDKLLPKTTVNVTVRSLQKYPMEEVLTGPYLPTEWRPDLINTVMDCLIPQKIRIHVVGKIFKDIADQSEFWYGTEYAIEKIPYDILENWTNPGLSDELKIPSVNEFIPQSFDIKCLSEERKTEITKFPTIILDNPLMRVWFKQDDEFKVPKVNLSFDFISPYAYLDPCNFNLTNLYIQLFKDSLNEYAYNASLARLSWEFSASKNGMTLLVGGYHDKHRVLLKKILDRMVNFTADKQRFEIIKELYIRNLKNFEADQPYQHAVYYLAVLLTEQGWSKDELLEAIEYLTFDRLEQFIPQLLSKTHIECLIHGNLTEAEALETIKMVENQLTKDPLDDNKSKIIVPLLPKQYLLHREISLDNGSHFLYEIENKLHKSSCTEIYYQVGLQSTESNMHLELLGQIISEPFFDVLRTQEQLGYIVFSGIRRGNGVQGLRIIIQGDRHPQYLEERIEAFIESVQNRIVNMSEEEFNRHKTSLANQRLEKPKKMTTLSAIFWSEITNRQYNFDRANIEVAYLRTITKSQILDFYNEKIKQQSPFRRKLSLHVVSTAPGGAGHTEKSSQDSVTTTTEDDNTSSPIKITDILSFKTSQSLYPIVKPFINISRKDQRSKL